MTTDNRTTTYVERNGILEVLYQALKDYEDGKFKRNCIAVGILNCEISAIYLAIEKSVQ